MPLFECAKCGVVENTAPSRYWMRGEGLALCSECDPAIGKWHGLFQRRNAKASGYVKGEDGFLALPLTPPGAPDAHA